MGTATAAIRMQRSGSAAWGGAGRGGAARGGVCVRRGRRHLAEAVVGAGQHDVAAVVSPGHRIDVIGVTLHPQRHLRPAAAAH